MLLAGGCSVAALAFAGGEAKAVGLGGGFTSGPDSSFFPIDLTFTNDIASTLDIVSILIDGSTADAFPILWDSPGSTTNPAGATSTFSGIDTQFLQIDFLDSPDGFNPGETFTLSEVDPDADPGPIGVSIADLTGVTVTYTFEDLSTWIGEFVDDPAPNAGLVLQQIGGDPGSSVPEPASTVGLLAVGALGISVLRKRKQEENG